MRQGHREPIPAADPYRRLLAPATLRCLAPKTSYWREAQFDTIRLAFIKVAARVTELASRIKLALPSSYPYRDCLVLLAARAAKPP